MKRNDGTSLNVLLVALAAVYLVIFLSGCTSTMPIAATGNMIGAKTGKASATRFCGIWIIGDASIATAARNGEINHIATVDMQTTDVLGIYTRRTCIVNGSFDNVPSKAGNP